MSKSLLQPARMSPDSVVIEFALIDLADSKDGQAAELWQGVDEQQIPIETRQELARQGFRWGCRRPVAGLALGSAGQSGQSFGVGRIRTDVAVVSDLLTEHQIAVPRPSRHQSVPVGVKCKEMEDRTGQNRCRTAAQVHGRPMPLESYGHPDRRWASRVATRGGDPLIRIPRLRSRRGCALLSLDASARCDSLRPTENRRHAVARPDLGTVGVAVSRRPEQGIRWQGETAPSDMFRASRTRK